MGLHGSHFSRIPIEMTTALPENRPSAAARDRRGAGDPRNVLYFSVVRTKDSRSTTHPSKLSGEGHLPLSNPRLIQRLFFFFFGGLGGGLVAAIAAAPSGVAATGIGMTFWIVYCCPIVQTLVVIQ